jgi:hypothetical protein
MNWRNHLYPLVLVIALAATLILSHLWPWGFAIELDKAPAKKTSLIV